MRAASIAAFAELDIPLLLHQKGPEDDPAEATNQKCPDNPLDRVLSGAESPSIKDDTSNGACTSRNEKCL